MIHDEENHDGQKKVRLNLELLAKNFYHYSISVTRI
jgi:hypothetical protein